METELNCRPAPTVHVTAPVNAQDWRGEYAIPGAFIVWISSIDDQGVKRYRKVADYQARNLQEALTELDTIVAELVRTEGAGNGIVYGLPDMGDRVSEITVKVLEGYGLRASQQNERIDTSPKQCVSGAMVGTGEDDGKPQAATPTTGQAASPGHGSGDPVNWALWVLLAAVAGGVTYYMTRKEQA